MRIGIIGAGNVGGGLAARLVGAGHEVRIAGSSPSSERLAAAAAASGATPSDPVDVAAFGEVVVLAVPFGAVPDVLTDDVVAALAGTVVVDTTNPLAPDFLSLTIGHTTSAGEQVAQRLPGSSVVKAFSTVMAATLATPSLGGVAQLLPVAGDDDAAKQTVLALGRELGFDAVDTGPLTNARYLEAAVELVIQLAYGRGLGPHIGLALLRG